MGGMDSVQGDGTEPNNRTSSQQVNNGDAAEDQKTMQMNEGEMDGGSTAHHNLKTSQ